VRLLLTGAVGVCLILGSVGCGQSSGSPSGSLPAPGSAGSSPGRSGGAGGSPSAAPSASASPSAAAVSFDPAAITVGFEPVVDGLDAPLAIVNAGDGSGRLFVAQQTGQIRIVRDGKLVGQPFLDIADRITSGGERFRILTKCKNEMPPLEKKQGEQGHIAACWVTK